MKRFFLFFLIVGSGLSLWAQVNVTFKVDMTGATVSADGVHLAGSLNGWNTTATPMTVLSGNIYSVTLPLTSGSDVEYKFLNGNVWGTEEAAPATCTVGGSNRIFTVPPSDLVLDAVVFGQCPAVVTKKKITFRVDMTGKTLTGNGVHVAGNFQGWNPGATELNHIGNNIYEIRHEVLSSILAVQYKFINGNAWGADESVSGACANSSSNRLYDISFVDSLVLPAYKFGTCTITEVTGLEKALEINQFKVYPTRTTDLLQVELGLVSHRPVAVEVLDMAGRVIMRQDWGDVAAGQVVSHELEVSALPDGLYLLRLTGLSAAVSARFQVAR